MLLRYASGVASSGTGPPTTQQERVIKPKPIYEIQNHSQGHTLPYVYTDFDLAGRIAARLTRTTGYTHIVEEVL